MLKFGIVGYDHPHIIRYAPTIASHPRVKLSAIAAIGVNRDLARNDSKKFGCPYFEDLDKALSSEELEAIYIGTEPSRHLEVIERVAEKGIHILCDKPIATTLEDADKILSLVDKYRVKFMVPFNPRYQLGVIKVKEMIDSGEIGKLYHIDAVKYGKTPLAISGIDTSWFLDKRKAGFGGFADIGIHAVYALRWFAGGEAKSVYAHIETKVNDIPVDDIGSAIIEFEGGVIGTLSSGWVNPLGFPTHLDARFKVLGSKKAVAIDKPYHDFTVFDQEKAEYINWWRVDIGSLVDEFINSILEDRKPSITGKDARAALEIIVAAYLSSENGEEVKLPL